MKKSIVTSGMAASNRLYLDSLTEAPEKKGSSTENEETQIYKWTVETEIGVFTGTCLSIDDVNEEIAMLTNNAKILKKNITPVTVRKENVGNKVYTWNVITHSGQASGVSVSLEEAKRVINSFGSTEVVNSNIIESFTNQNNH